MIDIFCTVIDNYGDIGFSLRLARSLVQKGVQVNLFTDNLGKCRDIASQDDLTAKLLKIAPWPDPGAYEPAPAVIEAFSCRLPEEITKKLKSARALVIELDYLTAEKFAEDCHLVSSSADCANSYFFFPGFTAKTGGLIAEEGFRAKISALNKAPRLADPVKASLFSYMNPCLKPLLGLFKQSRRRFEFTVFEGLAQQNLEEIYKRKFTKEDVFTDGNLSFCCTGMCDQQRYDEVLLSSDINFVRGEDSIVRAMLSGKIFIWQIYRQSENTHIKKLRSFFECIREHTPSEALDKVLRLHLAYNGIPEDLDDIQFDDLLNQWAQMCRNWSDYLMAMKPLQDQLLEFIKSKGIRVS